MAVRLQMKLGVVAETERLQDSPDTVAVVEPTIGATARSKGSLFLIVSGAGRIRRLDEATRLVADAIQTDYYYDESAGLVVCLEKAIRNANRRLAAQREKLGFPETPSGPIGIGVAVVRGNELYVVTSGPVEAYLVRQAHLLTLPVANRDNGLPHDDTPPEVWRGEITAGDTLILVSANITARLGADELKDAVVTLHPQAAMEHLHHRFVATGGTGSDGLLALEAREVSSTTQRGRLVPVKPAEPLAGQPDRSPIPLADSVAGGAAAAATAATSARYAAGGALTRFVHRLQDLLPRRGLRYRRVTPAANRREAQRRAAIAILAFAAVAAVIALAMTSLAGGQGRTLIPKTQAGERAFKDAQDNVRLVFDNGTDMIAADPSGAQSLLATAYAKLAEAEQNNIPTTTTAPVRARVVAGLDRVWGVVEVQPTTAFSFAGQAQPFDLSAMVIGSDGAPYVIDRAQKAVFRVDLRTHKAQLIAKAGTANSGARVGTPKLLGTGGLDTLILDDKNALWRWRPTGVDNKGTGTLRRIPVSESAVWGTDVSGFSTLDVNRDAGQYNLYVVDPSEKQIKKYVMVADGSGYAGTGSDYFTTARDLSKVTSVYIDGELYMANDGVTERYSAGLSGSWGTGALPDGLLRPGQSITLISSPDDRGSGVLWAFDKTNDRIIAFDKKTGAYEAQYRIAGTGSDWGALRAMQVVHGPGGVPTVYWIDGQSVKTAVLRAVTPSPSPSPSAASPSPGVSPSGAPSGSPKATGSAKPGRTPRPTPRPTRSP